MPAQSLELFGELNQLLPTVGRHEGQAMLLLSLDDGTPYTHDDLRNVVHGFTADGITGQVWADGAARSWCEGALGPIGNLVIKTNHKIGLNPDTSLSGQAFAAVSLTTSDSLSFSLGEFLGPSNVPQGIRPPVATYALIDHILKRGTDASIPEIAAQTALTPTSVAAQLTRLGLYKFIEYHSDSRSDTAYQTVDNHYEFDPRSSQQVRLAYGLIRDYPGITKGELIDKVQDQLSAEDSQPIDKVSLRRSLTKSFRNLEAKGIIDADQIAKIELTPHQRALWLAYYDKIEMFRSSSTVERQALVDMGKDFMSDRKAVVRAIRKARATNYRQVRS